MSSLAFSSHLAPLPWPPFRRCYSPPVFILYKAADRRLHLCSSSANLSFSPSQCSHHPRASNSYSPPVFKLYTADNRRLHLCSNANLSFSPSQRSHHLPRASNSDYDSSADLEWKYIITAIVYGFKMTKALLDLLVSFRKWSTRDDATLAEKALEVFEHTRTDIKELLGGSDGEVTTDAKSNSLKIQPNLPVRLCMVCAAILIASSFTPVFGLIKTLERKSVAKTIICVLGMMKAVLDLSVSWHKWRTREDEAFREKALKVFDNTRTDLKDLLGIFAGKVAKAGRDDNITELGSESSSSVGTESKN